MEKAKKQKKKIKKESFMQGVLALLFSQVLIKFLGLIYRLYLTNKPGFGDEGNAIYSAGYFIYMLLLTVSSTGVPNAISRLVAERTALGDRKGAQRIFKIALATFATLGGIGSLLLIIGAKAIATTLVQIPEAEYTLVALAPSVFFVSIASVLSGYFNGKQRMRAGAIDNTIEQIAKTIFTIGIVEFVAATFMQNTLLMAVGATVSSTFSTAIGCLYLIAYYRMYKKENAEEFELMEKQENYEKESVPKVIKRILSVSIPITLSSLMSSINKNVDSITVVRNLKTFMSEAEAKIQYGILVGKVDILIGLPLSFNIAFQIALVPAIAAALAKKDYDTINKRVSFSMLITMLIGFPCTIGMIVFASPILELLFSNGTAGVLLLQISALTIFFTVLVQTMNGVLQGIGKVMVPAKAFAVGVLAKFIFNMIFIRIPMFGINAAAAGSVLCHVIIFTIEFMVIKKAIGFKFEFKKYILKPALATIGMAIVSYGIYALMNMFLASIIPSKVITVIALLIAVVTYAILVLLLKVISSEEMLMIPYGNKINKFVAKFAR